MGYFHQEEDRSTCMQRVRRLEEAVGGRYFLPTEKKTLGGEILAEETRQERMLTVAGLFLVLIAVLGGYLLEHGQLAVLFQPAELLIIGGAAVGAVIAGNSGRVLKDMLGGLKGVLKPSPYTSARYLDTLKMLHDLFSSARRNGAARLEADIEQPEQSPIFSEHPVFLADKGSLRYLCDTLRLVLMGGVSTHELEQLMEIDAESHQHEASQPVSALQTMADSLPGLGIVAAVLGIVVTMGALGGPAAEIGHKVAAALVGTFLGVLLCYGFVGPVGVRLAGLNEEHEQYFVCLRQSVLAYVRGCGPLLAAEFGRRSIPPHVRPSFADFEAKCKGYGAAAPGSEATPAAEEAPAEA
jgi:chemotaxis protein MotA